MMMVVNSTQMSTIFTKTFTTTSTLSTRQMLVSNARLLVLQDVGTATDYHVVSL